MSRTIALCLLAALAAAADLAVEHPWSRATIPDAAMGVLFAMIRNPGGEADTLLSASSDASESVEIHEHVRLADGTMRMQEVQGGIPVPAGASVELKPGSYHLMLVGLKHGLVAGGTVDLTLVFAKAGRIAVQAPIKPAGAMAWDE